MNEQINYTKHDSLPLVLNAQMVADILGISLTAAFRLFDREDFPTLHIGLRRKLVSQTAFLEWLERSRE